MMYYWSPGLVSVKEAICHQYFAISRTWSSQVDLRRHPSKKRSSFPGHLQQYKIGLETCLCFLHCSIMGCMLCTKTQNTACRIIAMADLQIFSRFVLWQSCGLHHLPTDLLLYAFVTQQPTPLLDRSFIAVFQQQIVVTICRRYIMRDRLPMYLYFNFMF